MYELSRKSRMKERKQRYRLDELNKKSISALKEMMNLFNISVTGCFDKRDLIERLLTSDKIEIVEGAPVVELTSSELHGKNIHELHELLLTYGISAEGALEKKELIDRLVDSGRVLVVASESDEGILLGGSNPESFYDKSTRDPAIMTADTSSGDVIANKSTFEYKTINSGIRAETDRKPFALASNLEDSSTIASNRSDDVRGVLHKKGVKELCQLLRSVGVSTDGALEKEELIRRFIDSGHEIPQKFNDKSSSVASTANDAVHFTYPSTPESHDNNATKKQRLVNSDGQYFSGAVDPSLVALSSDASMQSMSVKELKGICIALGVDTKGCLDKADIYDKLKASGYLQ